MRWIAALSALLVTASSIPAAAGHATAGMEYEHLVWQDGTWDQTYFQDGWDLHDLWMWEAHDRELGDGLMLRFHVHGGNTTGLYDTLLIHASLVVHNETHTFSWATQDDVTWTGDLPLTVLESNHTTGVGGAIEDLPIPDEIPVPGVPDVGAGWMHHMQAFVPLVSINASVGDTVSGWSWLSTAQRDALTGDRVEAEVDIAPGGFWITGTPTVLPEEPPETPDPDAEPSLPGDGDAIDVFLQGPGRHIEASGEWDGGQAVIRIGNPYNETTQVADVQAPAGAVPTTGTTQQLAPGQEAVFRYDVPLAASPQHLVWDILTDIGGHARLEVSLPAAPPAPTPEPVPSQPLERTDPTAAPQPPALADDPPVIREKDSPVGLWLLMAAIGAVLFTRRR